MGEGALLAALERSRTGRMADIVATIQREQDEIVRSPLSGIVVVQGGPGTGKTAVALHRAAYLLYTYRFPLERAGVLLIGPSRIFLRYIEQVLPALGEHTVNLATPADLVPTPVRGVDRPEVALLKGDARMARVVAQAVGDRERGLPEPVALLWNSQRLRLSVRDSRRIVEGVKRRRGTHNERRAQLERSVVRHLMGQLVLEEEDDTQEARETIGRALRAERTVGHRPGADVAGADARGAGARPLRLARPHPPGRTRGARRVGAPPSCTGPGRSGWPTWPGPRPTWPCSTRPGSTWDPSPGAGAGPAPGRATAPPAGSGRRWWRRWANSTPRCAATSSATWRTSTPAATTARRRASSCGTARSATWSSTRPRTCRPCSCGWSAGGCPADR